MCERLEGVSASVAIRDDEAVSYRVVCRAMHGYIPREDVGLLLRYAYKYNSSICTERPVASTPRLTAC